MDTITKSVTDTAPKSEDVIRLKDICRTYLVGEIEVPVLKGISLSIQHGELVALMGASGSGKTTLMNIIGCLDHATSGQCWIDGEEVTALTPDRRAMLRNRKIGFVFQSFNLLPRTSALEQVMMPLEYAEKDCSDREAAQRAKVLLERVGLASRIDHRPKQLSGGQQQRVAIARSLINNPPLLLADEPTGNLDSKTTIEILEMFRQLCDDDGITVVMVTHDPNVAEFARRVVRIKDGVLENTTVAKVSS